MIDSRSIEAKLLRAALGGACARTHKPLQLRRSTRELRGVARVYALGQCAIGYTALVRSYSDKVRETILAVYHGGWVFGIFRPIQHDGGNVSIIGLISR